MQLDCYIVGCDGEKKFWFGSMQTDLSFDNNYISKFKNPKITKLRTIKSLSDAQSVLHTPETFLPITEAIEIIGNTNSIIGVKKRAIKKLKREIGTKKIWIDVSTSDIFN